MRRAILVLCVSVLGSVGCVDDLQDSRDSDPWVTLELPVHTVCGGGSYRPGIDVSVWQGTINWDKVKTSGKADFAYIRIGDGLGTDTQFNRNWKEARRVGVPRGAYHYFRPGRDPMAQAQHFMDMVNGAGGYRAEDLPPMIDVEATDGMGAATIRANMRTWIDYVQGKTGKRPIIYTGSYFWDDHSLGSSFADFHLWTAHYTSASCPLVPNAWNKWTIWQYSSSGSVSGISGNVDMNRFNGSSQDLARWPDCSTYNPISSCPPPDFWCDTVATLADTLPLADAWGDFQCSDPVDRRQWAVLVGDAVQLDQTDAYSRCRNPFTDVADTAAYAHTVATLAALDHGDGTTVLPTDTGLFRPGDNPTRCEAVQMIDQAWQLPDDGGVVLQFTDLAAVPTDCLPSLGRVVAAGIVANGASNFRPGDPLTANAAAVWVQRAITSFGRPVPAPTDFNDASCFVCTDACAEGEVQCNGNGTQVCVIGADGCLGWGELASCADGLVCLDGACAPPAVIDTDTAAPGEDVATIDDGFGAWDVPGADTRGGGGADGGAYASRATVGNACDCRTVQPGATPGAWTWCVGLLGLGLLWRRRGWRRA